MDDTRQLGALQQLYTRTYKEQYRAYKKGGFMTSECVSKAKASALNAVRIFRNGEMRRGIYRKQRWVQPFQHDFGRGMKPDKVWLKEFGADIAAAISSKDTGLFLDALNGHSIWNHVHVCFDVDVLASKVRSGFEVGCCEDCGDYDDRDYTTWVRGPSGEETLACDLCRDDSYVYSDARDQYEHPDYYNRREREARQEEEGDCDPEHPHIGDYHHSKDILGRIPSQFDDRKEKIYLGLELEVEHCDERGWDILDPKAEQVLDALGTIRRDGRTYTYAVCEEDGSLDDEKGFEIVTGWTGLDVHREQLKFFQNRWRDMMSHDSENCGLHVHVSKGNMTLFHAAKMVIFINDPANGSLTYALARRHDDYGKTVHSKAKEFDWLRRAKEEAGTDRGRAVIDNLNESDRYEALNFQNDATIEFRLFKGSLKYETIIACLEFAYMTWLFCRDTGVRSLTTKHFIEYICLPEHSKDTRILRKYLANKGFNVPKSALCKPDPAKDYPKELVDA